MKTTTIFLPALLLMFWTLTVLLLVPIRRVRAVMQQRLTPKDFSHGESARVPPDVALPNRIFMNLLEVPVLFYVVAFMAYLTGLVNDAIPAGIADFFRQTLSPVTAAGKKHRVAITETRYSNLHLITASPDLSDLQSKLESKFKINKLRKLLVELAEDYELFEDGKWKKMLTAMRRSLAGTVKDQWKEVVDSIREGTHANGNTAAQRAKMLKCFQELMH